MVTELIVHNLTYVLFHFYLSTYAHLAPNVRSFIECMPVLTVYDYRAQI